MTIDKPSFRFNELVVAPFLLYTMSRDDQIDCDKNFYPNIHRPVGFFPQSAQEWGQFVNL